DVLGVLATHACHRAWDSVRVGSGRRRSEGAAFFVATVGPERRALRVDGLDRRALDGAAAIDAPDVAPGGCCTRAERSDARASAGRVEGPIGRPEPRLARRSRGSGGKN